MPVLRTIVTLFVVLMLLALIGLWSISRLAPEPPRTGPVLPPAASMPAREDA